MQDVLHGSVIKNVRNKGDGMGEKDKCNTWA